MYKFISLCSVFVLVLGITACSKDKPEKQASTTTQQPAQLQQAAPAPTPQSPVKGTVLETMDAGGYTYVNVATDDGEKWIAVNQTSLAVGEEITYLDGMVMQNFFSKSLDRTFPQIVFSGGIVGGGAGTPSMPAPTGSDAQSFSQALSTEGTGAPTSTGSQKAVVPFSEIKVEKAPGENSYTVEEIHSKAAELNGKTVIVKGKVMKVSPRIMGRNWIHIQDGTGNPEANTHDLVVTSSEEPAADAEIITLEGVLAANKDFGSGYSYAVIIEEATIKE